MSGEKLPIIWDENLAQHRPLNSNTETLIGAGGDPENLISAQNPNAIRLGNDGKLRVNPLVLISSDANNQLTLGNDQNLYVYPTLAGDLVSAGGGNDLTIGGDGKLYINVDERVHIDGADRILTKTPNGLMGNVTLVYRSAERAIDLVGKNNQVISTVNLPETSLLESAEVVNDPPGQNPGKYLAMTFTTETGSETVYVNLNELVVAYTAGDASIEISNTNEIRVVPDPNDALEVTANGLSVRQSNLISNNSGNQISQGTDGKLFVTPTPSAGTASASANGSPEGTVTLAADSNTTARDLAATPAGVAAQITARTASPATSTANGANPGIVTLAADNASTSSRDLAATPAYVANQISSRTAGAATSTANGSTAGIVTLAADNNTTSRSMAATPAGVAAQVAAATPAAGPATLTADGTRGTVVYAAGNSANTVWNEAVTPAYLYNKMAPLGFWEDAPTADGADLNSYVTSGFYVVTAAVNSPSGASGFLSVIRRRGNPQVKQIWYRISTNDPSDHNVYHRQSGDTGTTWTPWLRFAMTDEIPTTATAATTTTNGTVGTVALAADNASNTARNIAATPALVYAKAGVLGFGACAPYASGANPDDYTTSGFYTISGDTANFPVGSNGYLMVIRGCSGTAANWVKQMFWRHGTVGTNDYMIYYRTSNNGGTSWGPWYRLDPVNASAATSTANGANPGIVTLAADNASTSSRDLAATPAYVTAQIAAAASSNSSTGTSGWAKVGNAYFQWGRSAAIDDDATGSVTFPIAFPVACRQIVTGQYHASSTGDEVLPEVITISRTSATFRITTVGSPTPTPRYVMYLAIGD